MKVGIVAQRANPRAASLAEAIADAVGGPDVDVWVDEATGAALDAVDDAGSTPAVRSVGAMDVCDLVVSIGGDGTFLFAAHGAGSTPILGVNLGEVGFLNVVAPEDAVDAVGQEVDRHRERGGVRRQPLARVRATGEGWTLPPALNEVAILGARRGPGGEVGLEVRVDGELYAGGRADGVLVATPTGSTAYNLAEGGPLATPGVDALVVSEMSAASAMPPLVVDADSEVTVRVEATDRAVVVADGRRRRTVEPPTRVSVVTADEPAHIAGPPLEFFRALGKLD